MNTNVGLAALAGNCPPWSTGGRGLLGAMTVPDRGFMTVADAATKLGIGRLRVIRLIKGGKLYGKRDEWRHWWARRDSVKKFLAIHGRGYKGPK